MPKRGLGVTLIFFYHMCLWTLVAEVASSECADVGPHCCTTTLTLSPNVQCASAPQSSAERCHGLRTRGKTRWMPRSVDKTCTALGCMFVSSL